jgi:prepilin-type N-terminal cleavage/methylation domain-containing protein
VPRCEAGCRILHPQGASADTPDVHTAPRRRPDGLYADGFTLIELLLVVAIVMTLAAIAVPGLVRARLASLESAAQGSLRAINAAESTYAASCGHGGYAQSLDDLAKPAAGSAQLFISPDIPANGVTKSGYILNVGPDVSASIVTAAGNTCNAAAGDALSSYFAEAHPASIGVSGQRSFATDTRASLYANPSGTVIAPGMSGAAPLQ